MRCISALPGLSASRAREVVAPYSTARPAQNSAMTTPWSVKNELKGEVLPKVASRLAWQPEDARPGSGAGAGYRALRRTALLPGNPEPAAALRGTASLGAPGLRLRRFLARRRGLSRQPAVGQLELAEGVADLRRVGSEGRLRQRQEGTHALDRRANLLGIALVLGPRGEARPPAAEADQREDRLDQQVVDADLLELGLVRGPQLFLSGWALLLAHAREHTSRASRGRPPRRPRAATRRGRAPAAGAAPR